MTCLKVEIIEEDVVWRDLDGEVVILNLATGLYYGLEGAGSRMWQLLAEHRSTDAVADLLAEEYDVERPRLARDLETLVHRLADKSIVRIV